MATAPAKRLTDQLIDELRKSNNLVWQSQATAMGMDVNDLELILFKHLHPAINQAPLTDAGKYFAEKITQYTGQAEQSLFATAVKEPGGSRWAIEQSPKYDKSTRNHLRYNLLLVLDILKAELKCLKIVEDDNGVSRLNTDDVYAKILQRLAPITGADEVARLANIIDNSYMLAEMDDND